MASGTISPSYDIYNSWALHYCSSFTGAIVGEIPGVSYAWHDQAGPDAQVYFNPPTPPAGEGYSHFDLYIGGNSSQILGYLLDSSGRALSGVGASVSTVGWSPPRVLSRAEWEAYGMRGRCYRPSGSGIVIIGGGGFVLTWYTSAFPDGTAATDAATDVLRRSVTLNGTINSGGYPCTYWFEWGLTTSYGNTTSVSSQPGGFNSTAAQGLSGLTPNTTYHYRAALNITSSGETFYGSDVSFKTLTAGLGMVV